MSRADTIMGEGSGSPPQAQAPTIPAPQAYREFLEGLPQSAMGLSDRVKAIFAEHYMLAQQAPLSLLKASKVYFRLTGLKFPVKFEHFLLFIGRVLVIAWEVDFPTDPLEFLENGVMDAVECILSGVPYVERPELVKSNSVPVDRRKSKNMYNNDDEDDEDEVAALDSDDSEFKRYWQAKSAQLPVALRGILKQAPDLCKQAVREKFVSALPEFALLGPSPAIWGATVPSDDAFKRQIDNRLREVMRLVAQVHVALETEDDSFCIYDGVQNVFALLGAVSHTLEISRKTAVNKNLVQPQNALLTKEDLKTDALFKQYEKLNKRGENPNSGANRGNRGRGKGYSSGRFRGRGFRGQPRSYTPRGGYHSGGGSYYAKGSSSSGSGKGKGGRGQGYSAPEKE
jgi:hypothetical protein